MKNVRSFILRSQLLILASAAALRLAALASAVMLLLFVSAVAGVPRLPFLLMILLACAACAASFAASAMKFGSAEAVIRLIQSKIPAFTDELLSCWQLSGGVPDGTSPELAAELCAKMEKECSRHSVFELADARRDMNRALLVLGIPLALNLAYLLAGGIAARIAFKGLLRAAPAPQPPFTARTAPPAVGRYEVTYEYPSYTEMPARTVSGNPNISGPAGTRVKVKASSDQPLSRASLVASWKEVYPAEVSGNSLSAGFTLKVSGTYRFEAAGPSGAVDQDPPEYAVSVTPDRAPEVELLSPADDLTASPDNDVPLVVQAVDDFGLTKAVLSCSVNGGPAARTVISIFPKRTYNATFEYNLKLRELGLSAGDRVSFTVEAWDNDAVNGPKVTTTRACRIETTDYELEHKKIEKDLDAFRDGLLRILADQNAASLNLKEAELAYSATAYGLLMENQRKVKDGFREPVNALKEILSRMEADPYTDSSTLSEYRGLRDQAEYLAKRPAQDALDAAARKDFPETGRSQQELSSSLEKMSLLAEDIWKYQKMRDAFDSGAELEKASSDLVDRLKGGKAKPEELAKALERINSLLDKLNKQLRSMPQELPEDFINSPAVKKIDLSQAKGLSQQMQDAINRGDYSAALSLASQLQKQLQDTLASMQEAGEDVGFSNSSSKKLQAEVLRFRDRLEGIVKKQESILDKAQSVDDSMRRDLFKDQEGALAGLARRQKELIGRRESLRGELAGKMPFFPAYSLPTSRLMAKVLDEFSNRRVYYSQKYLADIIAGLADERKVISANAQAIGKDDPGQFAERTAALETGEKEILAALQAKRPEPGEQDRMKMRQIGGEQDALSGDTMDLKRDLDQFSRYTSALDPEAYGNISEAASEMKNASAALSAGDSAGGMEAGRRALEKLMEGADSVAGAGQKLSGQAGNSGKPAAGQLQLRGGLTGARSAPVKLPGINDYKAPKEFRQDILDALREKYPKEFDKMIKDYYKRLTE